ncbi:ADP-glyceromanno-heptose 6-epimerase [Maricaulis sp.]|uniref:ADP-glyceromanno-heptose 6-epimerase n=1 Tax=Maricaulis sp. TaxID=1486257 RepID=UPI0026273DB0|nr:ADP-glyceromanno-heptose 6-epimerase [Maricaulis sp.]
MFIVTGGAGFIGSNIVADLAAQGKAVALIDELGTDAKWKNIAKHTLEDVIHPDQTFEALDYHAGRIEGIIHMGAISATTERDGDLIARTNFTLSRDLWDWCSARDVPFVYASSAATYGDGEQGFDDDDDLVSMSKLRPLNAYGWSKWLFDCWARRQVDEKRAAPPRWAGLKFFNVYGPNEQHKGSMRSVAIQVFEQVSETGKMKLFASDHPDYEDGGQMRDFVWVEDCARTAIWCATGLQENGIYNVGSGKARSFKDLALAVFAAMEREPQIEFIDMPDKLKGQYQYFTQARMSRLVAAGCPVNGTALEDGVGQYVRDFLATDDPFR